MPHAPNQPEFPAAIEQLAPDGVLDSLSALELGAWYRLQRAAWAQPEPCTLPAEDSFLAMVARITVEEWEAARPRLLLALAASTDTAPPPAAAGGTGRLTLGYARRVYESLACRAVEVRRVKQAAGRAGAESRWRQAGDGSCQAAAKHVPSPAMAAPSLRSEFSESSAPTLRRSNQSAKSERSEEGAPDVLATVGAGARAILAEKARDWRRKKSLALLEEAIPRWGREGFTSCPVSKAWELVEHESASPDRVEHLVQSADAMIARFKAGGGSRRPNPVGLLISGLGLSGARRDPVEVPLILAQRWASLESESVRAMESMAAIQARITSLRESRALGPAAQGGVS